jgi:uncharacterized protein YcfL
MKDLILIPAVLVLLLCSCYQARDSRVHLRSEVRSDSLDDNIVTRPVVHAFSDLLGEGIVVNNALLTTNSAGIRELHISGFNQSYKTKRFMYRVEWLDGNGLLLETKTSVWLPMSAMGNSPFSFKVVAPRPEAVNFRMDTRKWE